jgi:F-type H+-transporting ATPase subunit delta
MKVSSNYAIALVSAYNGDDLIAELENMLEIFSNDTIKSFFKSKMVDQASKFEVVSSNFQNIQIQNYLKLIIENDRTDIILDILNETYELALKAKSVKLVKVTLANELTIDQKSRFEQKLTNKYNQRLLIQYTIKPEILGGVIIEENNKIIDNSILGKKNRLMQHILGGKNV